MNKGDYLDIVKRLKSQYEDEEYILKKKYNKMFLELVPVFPYFKVGDYIKVKKNLRFSIDEINESKIYIVKEVVEPNLFDDTWRYSQYSEDVNTSYSYIVSPILANYQESKRTESVYSINERYQFELFVGGTKLTRTKDSFENWQPVNIEEINFIRLCQQVSEILNKLHDKRVNEQLNKYSKQSFISKKVLQDNPELLYIHENIEHLKKFQTHIKTNN